MLMRSDSSSDFEPARAIAPLCLPLSGNLGSTAGEDLKAPRLSASPRDGRGRARTELDDLLASTEARARVASQSKMSAGLRAARSDLQTRSASTREGCCEKEHPSQGIARSL